MEKEFYTGQPLIIKETGEKVTFIYEDEHVTNLCSALKKDRKDCTISYYEYEDLEPSTEFTFSELMAGLEQCYFEVGTKLRRLSTDRIFTVKQGYSGRYLEGVRELPSLTGAIINSKWVLVGDRKEMTLEEIEDELGYKIKLKENSDEVLQMDWQ